MSINPSEDLEWGERWDEMYEALAAEPRRRLLFQLLDEPLDGKLPLPDAAESPNQSIDSETLSTDLRHHHLPKLADAGYVRWESEPFCVQRGPHYEEPEFVLEKVLGSPDEIPQSLINNCKILQERIDD
jgi:hypothetical protein